MKIHLIQKKKPQQSSNREHVGFCLFSRKQLLISKWNFYYAYIFKPVLFCTSVKYNCLTLEDRWLISSLIIIKEAGEINTRCCDDDAFTWHL